MNMTQPEQLTRIVHDYDVTQDDVDRLRELLYSDPVYNKKAHSFATERTKVAIEQLDGTRKDLLYDTDIYNDYFFEWYARLCMSNMISATPIVWTPSF